MMQTSLTTSSPRSNREFDRFTFVPVGNGHIARFERLKKALYALGECKVHFRTSEGLDIQLAITAGGFSLGREDEGKRLDRNVGQDVLTEINKAQGVFSEFDDSTIRLIKHMVLRADALFNRIKSRHAPSALSQNRPHAPELAADAICSGFGFLRLQPESLHFHFDPGVSILLSSTPTWVLDGEYTVDQAFSFSQSGNFPPEVLQRACDDEALVLSGNAAHSPPVDSPAVERDLVMYMVNFPHPLSL